MPFAGGPEKPLPATGTVEYARWVDSVTVAQATQLPTGIHFAEVDVRSNAQRNTLDLPDSTVQDATPVQNGWAWIPAAGDRIIVRQAGRTHEFPTPAWYASYIQVFTDPSGGNVFFSGYNKSSGDSVGISALSLRDGSTMQWASKFADHGYLEPLTGGAELFAVAETQSNLTLYKLTGPGRMERIGAPARPATLVGVSQDLKRAVVSQRDYRADAWMSKVITR
jgi:hypothetical protein